MSLVDKVYAEFSMDYRERDSRAIECIRTRRMQLEYGSRVYCLLSKEPGHVYCPLQAEKKSGASLSECMRREYEEELHRRRNEKG